MSQTVQATYNAAYHAVFQSRRKAHHDAYEPEDHAGQGTLSSQWDKLHDTLFQSYPATTTPGGVNEACQVTSLSKYLEAAAG